MMWIHSLFSLEKIVTNSQLTVKSFRLCSSLTCVHLLLNRYQILEYHNKCNSTRFVLRKKEKKKTLHDAALYPAAMNKVFCPSITWEASCCPASCDWQRGHRRKPVWLRRLQGLRPPTTRLLLLLLPAAKTQGASLHFLFLWHTAGREKPL